MAVGQPAQGAPRVRHDDVARGVRRDSSPGQDGGALLHGRHGASRSAERERRAHADGARDGQGNRAAARQRDRAAGHSVLAERRGPAADRDARPHGRAPGHALRAHRRAGDHQRLHDRRLPQRPRRRRERVSRDREEARGQVPHAGARVAQHPRLLRQSRLRAGTGRLQQGRP